MLLALVLACTKTPGEIVPPTPQTEAPPAPEGTARDVVETAARDDGSTYRTVEAGVGVVADAHITADGTLEGTIAYTHTFDGAVTCSVDLALTGTPYTGTCEGCDFAFDVVSTRTAETNPELCFPYTMLTLEDVAYDGTRAPILVHLDTYTTPTSSWDNGYGEIVTYGGYVYEDMLRAGFNWYTEAYSGPYGEWPATEYGPFFQNIAWDGAPNAAFERDGDALAWTWTQSYETSTANDVQNVCDYSVFPTATSMRAIGIDAVRGEFPCVAGSMVPHDSWTFEARAGETVSVTVDTVADETAFDPSFWVNGPDTCTLAWVDEGFECTFPPPYFSCPTGKFVAPQDGVYEVFVTGSGICAGETAGYTLDVQVL